MPTTSTVSNPSLDFFNPTRESASSSELFLPERKKGQNTKANEFDMLNLPRLMDADNNSGSILSFNMLKQKTFLILLIFVTIFGGDASRGVQARSLSNNATTGNSTIETPLEIDSQPLSFDFDSLHSADNWRITMSSIFLRNLTNDMNEEVSELFSLVALDFLRYHSTSSAYSGEIDFIMVEVIGQAPEFGNSTQEDAHVDGISVFFETIVDLDDSSEIDLPRTIESIFRNNKNDLFLRLAEADDYFVPLYGKSHIIYETPESLSESLHEFVGTTWVASSLAAAACLVLLASALLTGKRRKSRKDYGDKTKLDTFPLRTLQTSSDDSTPTSQNNRQIGKVTNSYDSTVSRIKHEFSFQSILFFDFNSHQTFHSFCTCTLNRVF